MEIIVKKRDGTMEPFSYDKIVTSIAKCGIPIQASEDLASNVKSWVEKSAQTGTILSTEIRDKIIEVLTTEFPAEADTFKTYKK